MGEHPHKQHVSGGMADPHTLSNRLRTLADNAADYFPANNRAVMEALLYEAANALEQRLGLLRDTERRLQETVDALAQRGTKSPFLAGLESNIASGRSSALIALVDLPPAEKLGAGLRRVGIEPDQDPRCAAWLALDLVDAARHRANGLRLALRKRQATVDRQGHELGTLRSEVQRLQGLALSNLLTNKAVGDRVTAEVTAAVSTWLKEQPGIVRVLVSGESDGVPGLAAACASKLRAVVDGAVARATGTAAGVAVVGVSPQGRETRYFSEPAPVAFRSDTERERYRRGLREARAIRLGPPPETVLVGEIENGPLVEGRTITSGAELRAWLAADDGDPAAVITLAPPDLPPIGEGAPPVKHMAIGLGRRHTLRRDPDSYDPRSASPAVDRDMTDPRYRCTCEDGSDSAECPAHGDSAP